jgi:hypothetical protein
MHDENSPPNQLLRTTRRAPDSEALFQQQLRPYEPFLSELHIYGMLTHIIAIPNTNTTYSYLLARKCPNFFTLREKSPKSMQSSPLNWLKHVAYSRVPWFGTFAGKEIRLQSYRIPSQLLVYDRSGQLIFRSCYPRTGGGDRGREYLPSYSVFPITFSDLSPKPRPCLF